MENPFEEQEVAEYNAVAWVALTDDELAQRSGSLGLPANLATYTAAETVPDDAVKATSEQIAELRTNADQVARDLAGDTFVDAWIEENR